MEAFYNRRLAAILSADVVGYSRLVAEDEEGTLRTLDTHRAAVADLVGEHGGRIFGTAGTELSLNSRVQCKPSARQSPFSEYFSAATLISPPARG